MIAGTGAATDESIPTLREMLAVTRDRIFINIDNKLDIEALPAIVAVAREMGMADQIVIKRNLWNAEKIAEMTQVLERAGGGAIFMPIIADDAVRDPKFLEAAASAFSADAVELIAWHRAGEPMTADGGPLFGAKARAVAARGDWHLWVNTYAIVNKAGGMLSGGRGDELATLARFPGRDLRLLGRSRRDHHPDRRAGGRDRMADGKRFSRALCGAHRAPRRHRQHQLCRLSSNPQAPARKRPPEAALIMRE